MSIKRQPYNESAIVKKIRSFPENLNHLKESFNLIQCLRDFPENAALKCYEKTKDDHREYQRLNIDPTWVSGIKPSREFSSSDLALRPQPNEIILSGKFKSRVEAVVARCSDLRCSCSNVELNLKPTQVFEVSSAGNQLESKDLDSIAYGITKLGAKMIHVQAHGGVCGAVHAALTEMSLGTFKHSLTQGISEGLSNYEKVDTPEIFAATLENLDNQMGKILNTSLCIPLLNTESAEENSAGNSFYNLAQQGKIIVVGVFVDFEILVDSNSKEEMLIKRLTFLDSQNAFQNFVDKKIELYQAYNLTV